MSKTLDQIFMTNPITSNAGTDLMYFVQSPYTVGTDAAETFANFSAQFGAPYTASALTEANDTNVTLTLGGTPATALLQAVSLTLGWTGTLAGARGGLGAAITASNGGIYYSNASNGALLAGTATAQQLLMSGASTTPQWSTTTYPLTNAINTLLYASSANAMAALATANDGVLITSNTGVPSWLANSATPGYVLTANTGAPPSWQAVGASGAITTIDGDSGSATPSSGVITISGGTTGLTTSGTSHTLSLTGTLVLANGGTNANLTASNGGIVWSNASQFQILAGTATAGQILRSGATATPSWSTTTYPATNAINTLLYASAANVMSALATVTTAVLTTSSGVPTWATELSLALGGTNANLTASNGGIFYSTASAGAILSGTATAQQLLMSGASTTPQWSTSTYPLTNAVNTLLYASGANVMAALATANSSVLTTNGSGVPAWSTSFPSGFSYITTVDQASSSVTMAVNTQYIMDNGASLVTLTLPSTAAEGSIFEIVGSSSGGWKIAQAAGQQIHLGSSATTSGTGGSLASTNQWDALTIVCVVANTTFSCRGVQGNITVV